MLYAIDKDNCRIKASPKQKAHCPDCEEMLRAKCGKIIIWHWSHLPGKSCSYWKEKETQWHLQWKSLVNADSCEIKIGNHRADIVGDDNIVLELQHSSISPEEIESRESCYKNMVWIFNAVPFESNLLLRKNGEREYDRESYDEISQGLISLARSKYITFRWKHPRKSIWHAKKPIYFDFGFWLLKINTIHQDIPCGGWGKPVLKSTFIKRYLSSTIRQDVFNKIVSVEHSLGFEKHQTTFPFHVNKGEES